MAAPSTATEYNTGAVYGNLAYQPDYVYAPAPEAQETELTAPKKQEKTGYIRIPKSQGISLGSVIGFAFAAYLVVQLLLGYVELAGISASMSKLERQMTELGKESKTLSVEYEKTFNLAAVEDYAVHHLGMTKPQDSQIKTVSLEYADRAEVITSSGSSWDELLDKTVEFLGGLFSDMGG